MHLPSSFIVASLASTLCFGCAGNKSSTAPASTAAPVAAPTPGAPPDPAQRELRVFTRYTDFPSHGYHAAGTWFRHDAGVWTSAPCEVSHVADPEAGPPAPPTCGSWTPVDPAMWAALDRIRGQTDSIICERRPSDCADLGLLPERKP